jgi:RNA-directed DNA polymerase
VNTDAPHQQWPGLVEARERVLGMQTKLHRWSTADATARFDDLFNLVVDPAFLRLAWERVAGNTGARSAGIDKVTVRSIQVADQTREFLSDLRLRVKTGQFIPSPVKQRRIPKPSGGHRLLGIPTVADRVVQASLVLVLEPIFEADFHPSSYGFRPRRRAWDAVAEIQMFSSRSYEWVLEGDIAACFDEIDHTALMGRVRARIGDKRVLALVKAFLKAGALSEDQIHRPTDAGTPQGGILSPLLANIALEVLDVHFAREWEATSATRVDRARRRRHGQPVFRLVRYADDFVVLVSGNREHAEAVRQQTADVLAPMGLRLSEEKTTVVHIDEGFDFLGFRIQRHRKPGTSKSFVYTFPARKSVASVRRKVKTITQQGTNQPLSELLKQLNPLLRGWTRYFQHGVSKRAFGYLRHTRGPGWSAGCATSTARPAGRPCVAATPPRGGGHMTRGSNCSTRWRSRSPVTATGATSRHRGPSQHPPDHRHDLVESRMR